MKVKVEWVFTLPIQKIENNPVFGFNEKNLPPMSDGMAKASVSIVGTVNKVEMLGCHPRVQGGASWPDDMP